MDIVLLLETAVGKLPIGDHSTGLNAIVRHVKSAIRHIERDQNQDPDTFTDAIYRMNQAYEGSLKEAYRVLAEKDPTGTSLFDIENYLESHSVVRPRVLVQLGRYRQDYRNPSTHDYKLDFDEDEALLAIVSVCAFATLLTNQIASRIASKAAQERVANHSTITLDQSNTPRLDDVVSACFAYTNESYGVNWFEYEKGLAESLVSIGVDATEPERDEDGNKKSLWDVLAIVSGQNFFIDTRVSRSGSGDLGMLKLSTYEYYTAKENTAGVLVILRSINSNRFKAYRAEMNGIPIYLISDDDDEQLNYLTNAGLELKEVSSH